LNALKIIALYSFIHFVSRVHSSPVQTEQ